jgi:hypothetical protein
VVEWDVLTHDPRVARDAPYPWTRFFRRVEALATAAFLSIPYIGRDAADLFNQVVVPRCSPPRDRALSRLHRGIKSFEGLLACAILRLMPLPRGMDRGEKENPRP